MDDNKDKDELYDDEDKVKNIEVKVNTDDDYDDEEDEDDDSYSKNDGELKSKLFKFMFFIVGGMVVFLLILFIISLFTKGKKNYSYESVEEVMKNAAISYFEDNPSYLPSVDGGIVEVEVANLVAAGKMKDLSSYMAEGSSCDGNVLVENKSDKYSYTPYLDCGDSYSTQNIAKKIINDNKIVTSGYGLYHMGNEYVFRGEELNNYVSLGSLLWRIVKINSNNEVALISENSFLYLNSWDDRYNEVTQLDSGINNYGSSRIREYLQKVYSNQNNEYNDPFLSDEGKEKITSFNLCIGKRNVNSVGSDNQLECSEVLENQKIGLLSLSDYINASIDPNCKGPSNRSCSNYNYLVSSKNDWWLVTANSDDTDTVYYVSRSGSVGIDKASIYKAVRPVMYLSKNNVVKSGNGTLSDPYILK